MHSHVPKGRAGLTSAAVVEIQHVSAESGKIDVPGVRNVIEWVAGTCVGACGERRRCPRS